MKWLKNICMSLLVLSLVLVANSRSVFAADEEYTYTVRLYAGNQGTITKGGVTVSSRSAGISSKGDYLEISGLKYGDMVYITPQETVKVSDERYYIKGIRRSGRDNSESESPTFYVACDRDYVVAYGVKGDMAAYTVNYQDEEGRTLMKSDTYYGNVGERQYVSSRYIEGYQPKTLNMVKTLSANAAENVFTFQYVRVTTETAQTPNETPNPPAAPTTTNTGGTTTTTTNTGNTTTTANDNNADAGADNADAGADAEADNADAGTDAEDQDVSPGGDADVSLPDGDVPLNQQNLEDLDDGDVPMSDIKLEQGTIKGYMPIYIGIGAAAAVVLAAAAIYLYRRQKKRVVNSVGKAASESVDSKK